MWSVVKVLVCKLSNQNSCVAYKRRRGGGGRAHNKVNSRRRLHSLTDVPVIQYPPVTYFLFGKIRPFLVGNNSIKKKSPILGDMCRYLHKSELEERGIKPSPKTPEAFLQKAFIKKSFWAIIPKNYWWWGVPDKTYVQLNWTSSSPACL